jgi:predicted ATP-dependent protease
VNEKIEGFFDVCRIQGLTGQQGVLIPAANVRNLLLRSDVIDAIQHGQFHLYPIRTVDEGMEILTGVRAGTPDEDGTVNGVVSRRLRDLATGLRAFAASSEAGERRPSNSAVDAREGDCNSHSVLRLRR